MKKIILFLTLFACWQTIDAQVTTGSLSGVVRDRKGELLPGATVVATHTPTGTNYYTITSLTGNYNIQGMRVGGPYTVQISFMGYQPKTLENISISLGEALGLNIMLDENALAIEGVEITGEKGSAFNQERTGAVTNISNREMNLIPTLTRNLTDIAKLSPYSSGGTSFGGRESYMTNITVDGANFNNNFGLTGGGMPGVSGEPISMDAIEELQIVVAPFDVRHSNFTGAAINAVTKGGSNIVKGSAYGYFTNQNMGGKKIRDKEITNIQESQKQIYGFTVGAPIIKNKLFIFLNGEMNNELYPGNTLLAAGAGRNSNDPNVSNSVQGSDLQAFSDFLRDKFGYETGAYEDWGGDKIYNNKVLARVDWNAHKNHKVTLRYNYSKSSNVSRPSGSGDATPALQASRHGKTGGMSFENSQYNSDAILHSLTGELHSYFSNNLSNNLLVAYTKLDQPRSSNSSMFPFIDIMRGDAGGSVPYMSAGYELFSYRNQVENNTLIITDNVTYQLDKHTLTGGLSYEHQYFANGYVRQGTGYYRYKDLAAFMNHAGGINSPNGEWNADYHPLSFAYTYPINGFKEPYSELSFGQFSAYAQDEWSVRDNLKLTIGLRMDLPIYLDGAIDNPATHGLTFRDGETIDLGNWPKARMLWSPRLGFNWDVHKDRSLTLRGGTGIFTGRIPFVWFTNQPSNSGMLQYQLVINQNNADKLAQLPFVADVSTLLNDPGLSSIFPTANAASGRLAVIAKDFKLPQVWRTSIATDIKLPLDMMLTLEGIYSKDIHAIAFDNINLQDPDGKVIEGGFERDYYLSGTKRYSNSQYGDVVVMRNTNKGQSYSLSAQLKLPNWKGLSGDLAYTYSYAEEVTGKNGSDPFSAWRYRHTLNTLNSGEVGLTMNHIPHRLMASMSYYIEYARNFATTLSLFYQGYSGDSYSYIYTYGSAEINSRTVSLSANGDGGMGTYLAYLPENKDDVIWKSEADWTAYQAFIANDDYVKNHLGEYMKRYGARLPWNSRLDFRITQDIKIKTGKVTNKLQFTADIINIANLFNSKWGINKELNGSNKAFPILKNEGRDAATGKMIVSMNKTGNAYYTSAQRDPGTQAATWAIQLGLRYSF